MGKWQRDGKQPFARHLICLKARNFRGGGQKGRAKAGTAQNAVLETQLESKG